MIPSDPDLLRCFALQKDERAFQLLVERHLDLVHSVARRVTGSDDLARDVSQNTFIRLAQRATLVPRHISLSAWLHRTSRSLAIDLVRSEEARRKRETKALQTSMMETPAEPEWSSMAPVIDELVDRLSPAEREVVMLRFYQNSTYRKVAEILGVSEESARKRGGRAMEKLRDLLASRGIRTSTAALAAILPAHAATPAPLSLAASILKSTQSISPLLPAGTLSSLVIMTHAYKAACAGAIVLLLGATAYTLREPDSSTPPKTGKSAPSAASSAGRNPESSTRSAFSPPLSAAAVAKRARAQARYNQLVAKYGKERTQWSRKITDTLIASIETSLETQAESELRDASTPERDLAKGLGDLPLQLNLTNEQTMEVHAAYREHKTRSFEQRSDEISNLKDDPYALMSLMLAGDAYARSADLEEFRNEESAAMTELTEISNRYPAGSGPLNDPAFQQNMTTILGTDQNTVLQNAISKAAENTAETASQRNYTSLFGRPAMELSELEQTVGAVLQFSIGTSKVSSSFRNLTKDRDAKTNPETD